MSQSTLNSFSRVKINVDLKARKVVQIDIFKFSLNFTILLLSASLAQSEFKLKKTHKKCLT
jgi:hypothetical protein